jgi:hypothetical protein
VDRFLVIFLSLELGFVVRCWMVLEIVPHKSDRTLVIKLQPKLNLPGILRLVGKPKYRRKLHIGCRLIENEVGVIQEVEKLCPKLQSGFFGKIERLDE